MDRHLLGRVKTLTDTQTDYKDDGSVQDKLRSIFNYTEKGQLRSSISQDDDGKIFDRMNIQRDAAGRILKITDLVQTNPRANCESKFEHDSTGRLAHIFASSNGVPRAEVDISYLPDGRLSGAIRHLATGAADWRIEYQYGPGHVRIRRFEDDDSSHSQNDADFELDQTGRAKHVEYSEDTADGHSSGWLTYRYLITGITLVHSEELARNGKPCIRDFSLHHDGEVDFNSINIWGGSSWFCFRGPDAIQVFFDKHGNNVYERAGHSVEELGSSIMRWRYITTREITYY